MNLCVKNNLLTKVGGKMINGIENDLKKVISLYKKKPYLPFWGEIFKILQNLKRDTHLKKHKILLYETKESVPVLYQPDDGRFCIAAPGLTILLTQEQFIDSLLRGMFWPE